MWKRILSIITLSLVLTLFATNAFAAKSAADVLENGTFTYGESLTKDQYEETKSLLGVDAGSDELEVKINEMNDLLFDNYDYYQVYSSSYIVPKDEGYGIKVEIKTPQTITQITEKQYENAALTAGATNVEIGVASVKAVDGSGALAGVYKAYREAGVPLDQSAVETAQDELGMASDLNQKYAENSEYSPEELAQAITEVKKEVSELKDEKGEVTKEDAQQIVNNVFTNNGLIAIFDKADLDKIIDLAYQFGQLNLTDAQISSLQDIAKDFGISVDESEIRGVFDWLKDLVNQFLDIFESSDSSEQEL